jgi:hypothetical protein
VDRTRSEDDLDPITPEGSPTGEDVGDAPGGTFEDYPPDEPVDEDEPLTADEQRRPSLERRLRSEEPDTGPGRPGRRDRPPGPAIVDDDRSPEEVALDESDAPPEEAELDRTTDEVGEWSTDAARGAEEAAIHVVEEPD